MTMPRPAFKIDAQNPGSDLAGETAAALAAASIYYKARQLQSSSSPFPPYGIFSHSQMVGEDDKGEEALEHAIKIFDLANNYRGTYVNAIPAEGFYK